MRRFPHHLLSCTKMHQDSWFFDVNSGHELQTPSIGCAFRSKLPVVPVSARQCGLCLGWPYQQISLLDRPQVSGHRYCHGKESRFGRAVPFPLPPRPFRGFLKHAVKPLSRPRFRRQGYTTHRGEDSVRVGLHSEVPRPG